MFSIAVNEARGSGEVTESVKAANEAVIEVLKLHPVPLGPYGARLEELEVRRIRSNSHGGHSPFSVEPWVMKNQRVCRDRFGTKCWNYTLSR